MADGTRGSRKHSSRLGWPFIGFVRSLLGSLQPDSGLPTYYDRGRAPSAIAAPSFGTVPDDETRRGRHGRKAEDEKRNEGVFADPRFPTPLLPAFSVPIDSLRQSQPALLNPTSTLMLHRRSLDSTIPLAPHRVCAAEKIHQIMVRTLHLRMSGRDIYDRPLLTCDDCLVEGSVCLRALLLPFSIATCHWPLVVLHSSFVIRHSWFFISPFTNDSVCILHSFP